MKQLTVNEIYNTSNRNNLLPTICQKEQMFFERIGIDRVKVINVFKSFNYLILEDSLGMQGTLYVSIIEISLMK